MFNKLFIDTESSKDNIDLFTIFITQPNHILISILSYMKKSNLIKLFNLSEFKFLASNPQVRRLLFPTIVEKPLRNYNLESIGLQREKDIQLTYNPNIQIDSTVVEPLRNYNLENFRLQREKDIQISIEERDHKSLGYRYRDKIIEYEETFDQAEMCQNPV